MRRIPRSLPLLIILCAFAAFWALGGLDAVSAENLLADYDKLRALVGRHRGMAMLLFVGAYAALTSLVLFPAAFVITLAGGLMFGTLIAAGLSVIGVTVGGTVSFLVVRSAFADQISRWLGPRGERFRAALETDGFTYLLILRTSPVPFWIITLAAAAAGFRARPFLLATMLGVIPPCLVWANVGAGIADVMDRGGKPSLSMLTDPSVLLPLSALSAFGVISLGLRHWAKRRARVAAQVGEAG